MLNVEILPHKENGRSQESHYVVINGIPDYESYYYPNERGKGKVVLYDNALIEGTIIKSALVDLSQHFSEVKFFWTIDTWEFWLELKFKFDYSPDSTVNNVLEIEFGAEFEEWERPYSIKKFSEELKKITELEPNFKSKYFWDEEFVSNGFGLSFEINDSFTILENIIDEKLDIIDECLRTIHVSILNQVDSEILSVYFKFPDEIKSPCKQYNAPQKLDSHKHQNKVTKITFAEMLNNS